MAQTVTMYKRIGNQTISAPVPERLVDAHASHGWRMDLDKHNFIAGPVIEMHSLPFIGEGDVPAVSFHKCYCGSLPGTTCGCRQPVVARSEQEEVLPAKPDFYALLDKMRDIHDRKAADYAPGEDRFKNFRQCEAMGVTAFEGAVVRMSDKMSRVMNLIAKGRRGEGAAVVDESIEDTLFDLAVYALIAIQLHGEGK